MKQFVYVRINLNKLKDYDEVWFNTTCKTGFYGKLINQCHDTFYFEFEDGTMVAIPIEWVRWMAPIYREMKKSNG